MKNKAYLLALLAGLSLTSCESFLTEDARGVENLDTYYQTEEECLNSVIGCYQNLAFDDWWQIYNPYLMFDMVTDDLWMGNTTQTPDYTSLVYFQSTGASNGPLSNFWQYRYKGIANCNLALSHISKAAIDTEIRDRLVGELRFLRAFMYFDLVKNFGGVPLFTELEMPEQLEGKTRATQEEIYKFVCDELEAAAAVLPQRSEYAATDMGHATRGAALGFLGKAYLYQGKWQEAKDALETVITENEYDLLDNFGDVWAIGSNNSKESLFEIQTMYNGDLYNTGSSLSVITGCRNGVGDGWAWGGPTSDLENAYIAAGDSERLRWTIIKSGCTEIAGETQFREFVANTAATISREQFNSYKNLFGWNDVVYSTSYIIDPAQHKSARIMRKFFIPLSDRPDIYLQGKIPQNYRLLRYADVLLMYAEACNELGLDKDAREALNKVRNRAKLGDVTSSGTELRDAIRTERRLELACECQRLYDLRRWTCDNGKKMMCNIMGPTGSFVLYNTGDDADPFEKYNQVESSDKGKTFQENRDLLFPIPLYEIQNSNGSITQNPNW